MATGPQKTIYFFDPCFVGKDNKATDLPDDFWKDLFQKVTNGTQADLSMNYRGRPFRGQAGTSKSPAAQYLYVGRARNVVDWPDFADGAQPIGRLPVKRKGTQLVEPAYLTPVSNTRYWAMLRTSGGPSTQALQHWINHVHGMIDAEDTFELRPYIRKDVKKRLKRAQGASRFHARFEAADLLDAKPAGVMGKAMRKVQKGMGGGASVEMIVSFGNAKPTGGASTAMAKELNQLLGRHPSRLQGTLLMEDEEGNIKKDQVDLLKDRFTAQAAINALEGTPPTPDNMMSALHAGIEKFREHLK